MAANSDIELDGLASLCGHSVAMQKGTIQEEGATEQDAACKAEGQEGVEVLSFDSQTDANVAVASGHAEVGFGDSQLVAWIATESDGEFRVEGTPFDTAPYGFAVARAPRAGAVGGVEGHHRRRHLHGHPREVGHGRWRHRRAGDQRRTVLTGR